MNDESRAGTPVTPEPEAGRDERLRSALGEVSIAVYGVGPDRRFTFNEGGGQLDVLEPGSLVGLPVDAVYGDIAVKLDSGDIIGMGDVLRRVFAGEEMSLTVVVDDQTFENRLLPRRDGTGAVVGYVGVAYDVTPRERYRTRREALIEAERAAQSELTRFFELSEELLCVLDNEGRFTRVNPSWWRTLGHDDAALLARSVVEWSHPADAEAVRASLAGLVEGGSVRFEQRFSTCDGGYAWLSWSAAREGESVFAVVRDVTAQKRIEAAERARAEQRAALAELSRDALRHEELERFLDELVGRVTATLGVPNGEVFERVGTGSAFRCVATRGSGAVAAYGDEMADDDARLLVAATNWPAPLVLGRAGGELPEAWRDAGLRAGLWCSIGDGDRPYGVVGVHAPEARAWSDDECHFLAAAADIAMTALRRVRAERRSVQSQKLRAVGELAGGIAHDFNNLLTCMMSFAALAKDGLEDDEGPSADMDELLATAERGARLTHKLLAFAGHRARQPGPVDLGRVARSSANLLRRIVTVEIDIELSLADDLWLVTLDASAIDQILINLVINARDAMPDGGTLRIEATNDAVTGEYVVLRVADTGTGMSPEVQAKAFQPFFTTKGPGAGTGLGLATVYGLVEEVGGAVSIESELGRGTTFEIRLPRSEGSAELPEAHPARGSAGPDAGTVLVVEDEASVRAGLVRVVRGNGYRVLEAADGLEAVAVYEAHGGAVDVVLTDVVMPRCGGYELAAALLPRDARLRILFMTGYADRAPPFEGPDAARVELLPKPFRAGTLLRRLRAAIDAEAAAALE